MTTMLKLEHLPVEKMVNARTRCAAMQKTRRIIVQKTQYIITRPKRSALNS